MNKHDFYKELMSEYTFDAEKIKANAKRGKFARQKITPFAIGITAAVAACTVAVGTLAMTMLDNNNGVSLVDDHSALSAMSDTERLKNAMARLEAEKESSELKDVLVTFAYTLSPAEAQAVLTANGDVPVKALFIADGTRVMGEENIAAVFSENTAQITGAAINCSGIAAAELVNDSSVYLVEDMTEADFENLLPVDVDNLTNSGEDIATDIPEEQPVVPSEPVAPPVTPADTTVNSAPEATEPEELPDISDDPESIEVPDENIDENDEPEDAPAESGTPADTSGAPEQTEQPSDTSAEPLQPAEPAEIGAAELPDIKLPSAIEAVKYEPMVQGAESAFFIDDYVMYVKKTNGFGIYSVSAGSVNEIESVKCADAVVHWVSEDGSMLVSGKPDRDSRRSKLWFVSADNRVITDLYAEDSVMDGTLVSVGYNEDSGLLVMSIKEEGMYYLSAHRLDGSGNISYISDPFQSASKVTLMCAKGNTLYVAVADGALTQIIACDVISGDTRIIAAYDNNPTITKNFAFTHAVISPSDNALTGVIEVFDPTTENFVRTDYFGETLYFGVSRHSFEVNDRFYTVTNGLIVPTEAISAIAEVEYKKSLSSVYAVTGVNNEYVTIRSSAYSRQNLAAALVFGNYSESCTDAQKQAFIGAVGVNNALALGKCREAGLTKPDKLISAIEAYYSADAAAALISDCSVSRYGALSYNSGSLRAINAEDCVLVISEQGGSTAAGTVYIKAGTIGGKTAYTTCRVNFVAENGLWKLAGVLA